ncbi:MAG: hypothetical protein ABIA63_09685 [bacterium]
MKRLSIFISVASILFSSCSDKKSVSPVILSMSLAPKAVEFTGDTLILTASFTKAVPAEKITWHTESGLGVILPAAYVDTVMETTGDTVKIFYNDYPSNTDSTDTVFAFVEKYGLSAFCTITIKNLAARLKSLSFDSIAVTPIDGFYRIPGNPNTYVKIEVQAEDPESKSLSYWFSNFETISPTHEGDGLFTIHFNSETTAAVMDTAFLNIKDNWKSIKFNIIFVNYQESGVIWLADNADRYLRSQLIKFSATGEELIRITNLNEISSLGVIPQENKSARILAASGKTLYLFSNKNGRRIDTLADFTFLSRMSLHENTQTAYVCDNDTIIKKVSFRNSSLALAGTIPGRGGAIDGIDVDQESDTALWFCTRVNNKVYKAVRDKVVDSIPLNNPRDLAVDGKNRLVWVVCQDSLFLLDADHNSIKKAFVLGELSRPNQIAVNHMDTSCWIADMGYKHVARVSEQADTLSPVLTGLSLPKGIAVYTSRSQSVVWVTDAGEGRLYKLDAVSAEVLLTIDHSQTRGFSEPALIGVNRE